MARAQTIGQHLLFKNLPQEIKEEYLGKNIDSKTLSQIESLIIQKHPENYGDFFKFINDVGVEAQGKRGGFSPNITHFKESPIWKSLKNKTKQEVQNIYRNPRLSKDQKRTIVKDKFIELSERMNKEIMEDMESKRSPVSAIVKSGFKGNPRNITQLVGSSLQFSDAKGNVIPIPIYNGYGFGLSPSEYWASSYGTRKGIVDMKLGVAKGGWLSKQLIQIAGARGVIVGDDDEVQDENRGYPVDINDDDTIGALLARSTGGYKRNTVITKRILKDLRKQGFGKLLIRSPIVGGSQDGGLYSKDVGIREQGRLLTSGENPGVVAAAAIAEPISQSLLCLAEGTLVRMSDYSVKEIQDIKKGEMVLGVTKDLKTIPVKVVDTFDNGPRDCYKTKFQSSSRDISKSLEIECTLAHRVYGSLSEYDADGMVEHMDQYPISDKGFLALPLDKDYKKQLFFRSIISQESLVKKNTYDIEVDSPNHLFVLANGLIVSNSSKHSAGVVTAKGDMAQGFPALNQLIQTPTDSVNWAQHSSEDGLIQKIEEAPQGGYYIYINNKPLFSYHRPIVKLGDEVEQGDILSEGLPNPEKVTEAKGIGEGRRYFIEVLRDVMKKSGTSGHRRNLELIARGLVNHIELEEELDAFNPGDKVPYNMFEKYYRPRENSREESIDVSKNKYLEKPVLHYTIGTRITPKVIKELDEWGIKKIMVNDEKPKFHPVQIRGAGIAQVDPDWATSMFGSGIKSRLLKATHRGESSNPLGTSYVSAVAFDRDFGTPESKGTIRAPILDLDRLKTKKIDLYEE